MKNLWFMLILLTAWPLAAQTDYEDIRAKPAGLPERQLNALLEGINSGDTGRLRTMVAQEFAPQALAQHPLEELVAYLAGIAGFNGQLSFEATRHYDYALPDTELVYILRSARTDSWLALTLHLESEPPHKILQLELSPARTPSYLPRGTLSTEAMTAQLAQYAKTMAARDVFSGAVLLARADKVLYSEAFGQASKSFDVANKLQTKFNLGSMNKMFTSVAVMQLVEAGKLSLDDRLSQFVDASWLERDISSKIQIRHLLSHTSGLGSYFNQRFMDTSRDKFRELEDYKPLLRGERLRFEPGSDWAYSNTGMLMLGVVIEQVSGQSYFDYVREHIFIPAGMINTDSYEMDQPVANLAIGYSSDSHNETGWRNNLYRHVIKGSPAGGGYSTVEDLHRFALALTGYKLLSQASTEALYTPKPELQSPHYGYGFGIRGPEQARVVGHSGGFAGISTNLDIFLDAGYVAVVLSNYDSGSEPLVNKINQLLEMVPQG